LTGSMTPNPHPKRGYSIALQDFTQALAGSLLELKR